MTLIYTAILLSSDNPMCSRTQCSLSTVSCLRDTARHYCSAHNRVSRFTHSSVCICHTGEGGARVARHFDTFQPQQSAVNSSVVACEAGLAVMALSVLRADTSVMAHFHKGTKPPTLIEAAALFCAEYTVPWQVLINLLDAFYKVASHSSLQSMSVRMCSTASCVLVLAANCGHQNKCVCYTFAATV
jgi:hypothetical protein